MRLICFFEDTPEMLERRRTLEPRHLEYLALHESEILLGGGLRERPGHDYVGGLWVLEVESFERARYLVENDPYYSPAHRKYRLLVWGKAFDKPVIL